MRLKPRKTFKTTLYGEAFILWLWAIVSRKLHIFYTSANATLLKEVATHLNYYLKTGNNNLYTFVFEIERDPELLPNTFDVFNIKGKDDSIKGSSLMFRPAGGSVNGVHPHIVIVDDPMDLIDRQSPAVRAGKEMWFDTLTPLLTPFEYEGHKLKFLLVIATRWHLSDLISYILKKDSQKVVESDKFDIEIESIYDYDGNPSYPDFFPEEEIRQVKSEISDIFFACQYLNNPLPEGIQVFDKNKMWFFDPAMLNLKNGQNACFLDPSKGKAESDYPAVIWVNYNDGVVRVFDAIDKLIMLDAMLKLIAKKNDIYKIPLLLFEDNGTMLLDQNIVRAHKEIAPKLKIKVQGIHEGRNKDERIINMQPNLYNGSVQFRMDYKKVYPEAMNQVFFYPAWGFVDYPDVVEKAVSYFLKPKFEFRRYEKLH